ncbi:MAG TPA: wax ester/triacylglycerol synthase domain-containing protein [Ilumatobacteraceae bacterium]|nr:wax ester/triacylglycerol synthase domain-containing protein [Ilumatobacteraceae bacterium]
MSESDSVLWHIERDPLLRSTITSVWFLDSVPDRRRMDAVAERLAATIPRLRQRVVDEQPGVAPPRWTEDPNFDVDYHYSWARLPGRRVGRREVLDHAQRLAGRSFDRDRPLWELCVIEGLPGKRAAFVMKVHHAIADGLGLVQLLSQMVDLEADPTEVVDYDVSTVPHTHRVVSPLWAIPGARSLSHRIASEARTGARIGKASLRTASELLRDPLGTIEQLGRTTGSIARVVMPATTPLSALMTQRSLNTCFDAVSVPFADFKAAARSVDATLNDAFVATTLDALRRYHDAMGSPCSQVRMNMPVSVRGGESANRFDNQFVPTRMVLPLSDADAATRLAEVKALLRTVTAEPALPHVNDISGVISRLGPAASVSVLGAMLKGVDITTSNVPGPSFPVFMAGAEVEEFQAFGPLAGAAINITLFSYAGAVHLGINSDRAAVVDHDLFTRCVREAIDATLTLTAPV